VNLLAKHDVAYDHAKNQGDHPSLNQGNFLLIRLPSGNDWNLTHNHKMSILKGYINC
jgi:hypothetical protein